MNPSSPVINIPSTASSNPEGNDNEWEPPNSFGGNSSALENSLNRDWRLGASGRDSLRPSRSVTMPVTGGFRAMSLQEPRTLWGFSQALRQEVHYEGRLERRVDSNGYTSWDPCWCELNDGEFKYAPVVEPPGGGGNDHAYTSSGSGGSSSNTKGGSAHSQDRSGGSLRNSNHRSGSSEEHPDRRISSGSGGGSVPLESAVAVRTVRGAPHSFTVVVADGSGLVFRASDRSTYQEWLFHFHSSILAIAERIRDRNRTHRSLLSRDSHCSGGGAPRVSAYASGSGVSTGGGLGGNLSSSISDGVGASGGAVAGGGSGSGVGGLFSQVGDNKQPNSEGLSLRRLPTRDSSAAEQNRTLHALAAAAPASNSSSSSFLGANAAASAAVSPSLFLLSPPSFPHVTSSSPSALSSSLSSSMPASPSLFARSYAASGASPPSQLQRPLNDQFGGINHDDDDNGTFFHQAQLAGGSITSPHDEYFGHLNDEPRGAPPLPLSRPSPHRSEQQQAQPQQKRPTSSPSAAAVYATGSLPPLLPPSPPRLPFLPSSAALSSSLGLGHGHLYYGGRRRAMSQRESSDRDRGVSRGFTSSSGGGASAAVDTGSPRQSGFGRNTGGSSGLSNSLASGLLLAHRNSSSRSTAYEDTQATDDFASLSGFSSALTSPNTVSSTTTSGSASSSSGSSGINNSLEGQPLQRAPTTTTAASPTAAASVAPGGGGVASPLEGAPVQRVASGSPSTSSSSSDSSSSSSSSGVGNLARSLGSTAIEHDSLTASPSAAVASAAAEGGEPFGAPTNESSRQRPLLVDFRSGFGGFSKRRGDGNNYQEEEMHSEGNYDQSNQSSPERSESQDSNSGSSALDAAVLAGLSGGIRGPGGGIGSSFLQFTATIGLSVEGTASAASAAAGAAASSNQSLGDSASSSSELAGGLHASAPNDYVTTAVNKAATTTVAVAAGSAGDSLTEGRASPRSSNSSIPSSSTSSTTSGVRKSGGALRWRSGAFCAKGAREKNEDTYYLCDNWEAGGVASCKSRPADTPPSSPPAAAAAAAAAATAKPTSSPSLPEGSAVAGSPSEATAGELAAAAIAAAAAAAAAAEAAAKRAQGSFSESRDARSGAFVSSRARGGGGGGGLRYSPPRRTHSASNGTATNGSSTASAHPASPLLFPSPRAGKPMHGEVRGKAAGAGGEKAEGDEAEAESDEGFWAFYGVYDGHCGAEAAEVAATGLHHDVFAPPPSPSSSSLSSSSSSSSSTDAAASSSSSSDPATQATTATAAPVAAAAASATKRRKQGTPASWAQALDGEAGAAEAVLDAAFLAMDTRYLELARAEGHYSGTTAVCALVCNKGTSLVVANLGDSAAVLLRRRSSFPSEKSSSSSSSSASSSSSDGSGVSTSSSSSSSASSSSRGGSSSADPGSADPSQISTADRGPDSSRESSSSSSRNKTRSFAYEAVKLTEAHKPGAPAEQARVEAAGGWITEEKELFMGQLHRMDLDDPEIVSKAEAVVQWQTINRVCGDLAVSRSLGDPDFKGFSPDSHAQPPDDFIFAFPPDHPRSFSADLVLATPDTTRHDLRDGDEYLVLASDGLWDVLNGQEVADAVAAFSQRAAHRANHDNGNAVNEGREGAGSSGGGGNNGNGNGNGNGASSGSGKSGEDSSSSSSSSSNDESANAAEQGESELETLAEELVRLALRLGSADNITVAVVRFEYE